MSDYYIYKGAIKQWIAADVVEIVIDLGFKVHKVQKFKIHGYTPPPLKEGKGVTALDAERGQLALNYVRKVLKAGSIVDFQSVKIAKLTAKKKHKYEITILYRGSDDEIKDFGKVMKAEGHSR